MNLYKTLARPFLFQLPADRAHDLTLDLAAILSRQRWMIHLIRSIYNRDHPELHQNIWGLTFRSPVGVAAGFDKNGHTLSLMEALDFGYIEVGSITANACIGNPKPRSWRLPKDRSLINRLGLNNDGAKTVVKRLIQRDASFPLGINIAKTHSPNIAGQAAFEDYQFSFLLAKPVADYITLNISCPNTEEGKTFEDPETLNRLLDYLSVGDDSSDPPVLIKLSVDLDEKQLEEILDVTESFAVSGYVAVNTSSGRENLQTDGQTIKTIGRGGLSGKAISAKSTAIIENLSSLTKGEKTIIGIGGIFTAQDAIEKLKAGADLLQVYTGMVYEGPGIAKRINKGISEYLEEHGLEHVYQIKSQ
ncbi:MAG: quinone-dependent dihydroorotate dehydrogenase [Balneolaceae bacterium]